MALLHVSINAEEPPLVAGVLADLLAGKALPFPSCSGAWIAFSGAADGTAIEVYPISKLLTPGDRNVVFSDGGRGEATGGHVAITSALSVGQITALARKNGWLARVCDRGPFECVELWLENRQLIEVLDDKMAVKYRREMTAARWPEMYDLD